MLLCDRLNGFCDWGLHGGLLQKVRVQYRSYGYQIMSCERLKLKYQLDLIVIMTFILSTTLFLTMQYVKNAVCEQKNIYANEYLSWIYLIVKYKDGVIAEINTPFPC